MKFLKSKKLTVILILCILAACCIYYGNNSIAVTKITYVNEKIADEFDGYKIVHISDLHNKRFSDGQSALLDKIAEQKPDIIVVTGDLIDARRTNIDIAMEFIDGAVKIAPVYYVTGNHEMSIARQYDTLRERMLAVGVTVLENECVEIEKNGSFFNLYGISDHGQYDVDSTFERLNINKAEFNMLLSHRPELIEKYAEFGFDIVFSGHAHGGQVRIPLIGGLYAPNQGLFPKYTAGMYTMNDTSMIVSRGLGNSVAPIRVFNRPEVVVCTLKTGK